MSKARMLNLKTMKNAILLLCLSFVASTAMATEADSTGLEGDNLDLNAVLEIFKESESPEDFEKKLNSESNNVNNLDLNEDGEVDYIRVVDSGDSAAHALTLQVPVTESESQDVAVIEIEETAKDTANLQIVGDEELYGENYILVPQAKSSSVVMLNVYSWRPVRHMWGPKYVFWVSPWRYKHHPKWYRPWKRVHWNVYHGRVKHHHGHCRRVYVRHHHHAHNHHYHRTHSASFHKAHHHKHAKTVAKPNQGIKAKSKTPAPKKAKKKQAAPMKSSPAAPKQSAAPMPSERKRPGAANDQSKPKTNSTNKTKSGTKKKSPSPKSKSSGRKGGRKRN